MAHLNELIDDLVVGEDRELPRSVDISPIEDTIAKAWFTVKRYLTDDDVDAIIQKEITAALTADGHIDDIGSLSPIANAHLYFLIPSTDTLLLEPDIYYYYDVKGKSSSNAAKKVLEAGRLIASAQITQAES